MDSRRLIAGGLAASAFLLASCSGSADDPDGDALSGSLRIVSYNEQTWGPAFESAAKGFMEEHPDASITVEYLPFEGFSDAIQTQLIGGTAGDLIHADTATVSALAPRGFFRKMDEDLSGQSEGLGGPWADHFVPGAVDQYRTSAGDAVLIPWSQVWVGLFYNQEIFKSTGASDPPETWDEWMSVNKAILERGTTPLYVSLKNDDAQTWWLATTMIEATTRPQLPGMNLRHADGWEFDHKNPDSVLGESLTADELFVAFDKGLIDPARSDGYRAAIETLLELKPYLNDNLLSANNANQAATNEFINGRAAQSLNGSFNYSYIDRELAKRGAKAFEYGTTTIPSITQENFSGLTAGGTNSLVGVRDGFVVPEASKNGELAVSFLQYLTDPKRVSELYTVPADIPPTDPSSIDGVTYPDGFRDVDVSAKWAQIPIYDFGGPPTFDTKDFDEFIAQWQGLWSGSLTVEEFLTQRSASNRKALERNLDVFADEVDREFIDEQLDS
jgi:ABC-type glycerol-3-phosphate transport system substrate-binding protein